MNASESPPGTVRFIRDPGVGGSGSWQRGTVAELLLSIPYLFVSPLSADPEVPPMSVVNDLLARGEVDAGMSGGTRWKPFQISSDEYDFVVEDLLSNPDHDITPTQDPSRDCTYDEWQLRYLGGAHQGKSK